MCIYVYIIYVYICIYVYIYEVFSLEFLVCRTRAWVFALAQGATVHKPRRCAATLPLFLWRTFQGSVSFSTCGAVVVGKDLRVENKFSWVHHQSIRYYHPSLCVVSAIPWLCWGSLGRRYRGWVRRLRKSGAVVFFTSFAVGFAATIVARILNGLGASFRFGGTIGSCRPNTYVIVGSFESESIVTICGPGDAMDDSVIISRALLPYISVELRTIGVLVLGGLGSFDDCST